MEILCCYRIINVIFTNENLVNNKAAVVVTSNIWPKKTRQMNKKDLLNVHKFYF